MGLFEDILSVSFEKAQAAMSLSSKGQILALGLHTDPGPREYLSSDEKNIF